MKIGVVGLGAMGSGIAQLAIEAGFETVGRELELDARRVRPRQDRPLPDAQGREGHARRRARATPPSARLALTADLADLPDCDVVIEAAFEDLAVKHELFRVLEAVVRDDAILATNTSALSVTEIASVLERPERMVGMHFFNPAPLMPLVEIVRAERTSDECLRDAAFELGRRSARRRSAAPTRPASSSTVS